MKTVLLFLLLLPSVSYAKFIFQYGLNYDTDTQESDTVESESSRMFHKVFLGAAVNGRKTLFFGWNINSWSSSLETGGSENEFSMTEMGPRLTYYFNDSYSWYTNLEWNPYARGERGDEEVSGSSLGFGIGYRFKLSRLVGLGAGLHYHSLSLKESKVDSIETNISDKRTGFMPMLELTILTR